MTVLYRLRDRQHSAPYSPILRAMTHRLFTFTINTTLPTMLHIHSQRHSAMMCLHYVALILISPSCIFASLQVTEHLAARSAQLREAAVHYQLGLMAKAIHAWYTWLGRHLSNATARQEHLLIAQVRPSFNAKLLSMKVETESTAHMGAQQSLTAASLWFR
jgi:hypothetical protein